MKQFEFNFRPTQKESQGPRQSNTPKPTLNTDTKGNNLIITSKSYENSF